MTRNATARVEARRYMLERVVNALLRENVQGITQHARVMNVAPHASNGRDIDSIGPGRWLEITRLPSGTLWLPVAPERFMQRWRYRQGPVLAVDTEGVKTFTDAASLVDWLGEGLSAESREYYQAFADECRQAECQRVACRQAQRDYFTRCQDQETPRFLSNDWWIRFIHYDCLASFVDHPYYPTARAKLGFDAAALEHFAPEFQPRFKLRWLAAPKALFQLSDTALPDWWPNFKQVGLENDLAVDHQLLPVHPFLWTSDLDLMLREAGLSETLIKAPLQAVEVQPTLSVRSLMLTKHPATHIKLPLTIRTLGSRNIRTIKPSTIGDGHRVQRLLGTIAEKDERIRGRLLLTDEHQGGHVAKQPLLGFILRRYPKEVEAATIVSVAGLIAPSPYPVRNNTHNSANGSVVYAELAERFYNADVLGFLREYLRLTFDIHLALWLRYGVALESNQQNSMLLLSEGREMRLLLKDNDAPRLHRASLESRWPALYRLVETIEDQRIWCESQQALEQMFVTITLQLNVAPLIEHMAAHGYGERPDLYGEVRQAMTESLNAMPSEDGSRATQLFESDILDAKYLLTAGTLTSKRTTGARDINKFYGKTAPNFLKETTFDAEFTPPSVTSLRGSP